MQLHKVFGGERWGKEARDADVEERRHDRLFVRFGIRAVNASNMLLHIE